MADEPQHPALVMLLKLEARLNSLADELGAVRGRLAYVEGRLAQVQARLERLEAERDALLARDSIMDGAVEYWPLDVPEIAPSLLPGEDQEELAELVRRIMARRTHVHVLSDVEKAALEAGWRNDSVASQEGPPSGDAPEPDEGPSFA
jgi:chromosome segregation ATPase